MTQLLFPESIIGADSSVVRRRSISRDEMNLAEFPLTVLSTRVDPTVKTLEFSDTLLNKNGENVERKWIITGADKFGLPTASDDEVLLGLMKLTVEDGFRGRKVFFSRYELLRILRWTTEGRSYTRLQRALDRLSGVRIKATNAFYDNEAKSHSTRNFGIVDAYEINDGRSSESKPSFFEWSEAMFKSFQVGFIKKLDLEFYLNLSSAISKRLYRFLDKHFWYRSRLTMNLFVLAHEKVGVSRNYQYASSLRQQLDPALSELKDNGFISAYEYSGKGRNSELTVVSANARPRSLGAAPRSAGADHSAEKNPAANSPVANYPAANNPAAKVAGALSGKVVADQGASVAESLLDPIHNEFAAGTRASPEHRTERYASDDAPLEFSQPRRQGTSQRQSVVGSSAARTLKDPVDMRQVAANKFAGGGLPDGALEELLLARGLQAHQVRKLTERRSQSERERMREIISHYDRLRAQNSHLVSRSPVGFLYRAMERPETFMLPGESAGGGVAGGASRAAQSGPQFRAAQGRASAYSQGAAGPFERRGTTAQVPQQDRLADLQARYLETRKRAMLQIRKEIEPELLAKMTQEVESALEKLRKLITPVRFSEAIEHGIEERLAKLFAYPDFDEWLQQQRLAAN